MTATETFIQLREDILKAITAIGGVQTFEQMRNERLQPNYQYNQEKHMREYWIALGQFSISSELGYLTSVVNASEATLPKLFESRQDLKTFYAEFVDNEEKIIASFDSIIGHPNRLFIGYNEPITMEQFLNKIVDNIHTDAINLDYNYQEFLKL